MKAFVIACLCLGGCATAVPTPVVKYQTTVIAPPANFVMDCSETPPPAVDHYLSSPWNGVGGKEQQLSQSLNANFTNLNDCNLRLSQLRDWIAKQQKLYSGQATFIGQQPAASISTPKGSYLKPLTGDAFSY